MDIALNSPISPMEPLLAHDVQDNDGWVYQVKWDGVRILCHLENKRVWLWNKRLHQRTAQYPELQKAASLIKGSSAIIDGEAIVIKNGRPSFPAIMSRDSSRNDSLIRKNQKSLPVEYMVFDLLYLDGQNLSNLPLNERRNLLENTVASEPPVHLVENFACGTLLYKAVKKERLEGIVAKDVKSCYISGKSHRAWFKYKIRLQCQAVIGGFIKQGNNLKSLHIGLFQGRRLNYIGRVSTGLDESTRSVLMHELSNMSIPSSPFVQPVASLGNTIFVRPVLTVSLEFTEWTEDLNLRQPVIIGFSTRRAEDCRMEDYL